MSEIDPQESVLEEWIQPEIVEMSVQCSAANAGTRGSDGGLGALYHRS